MSSKDRIGLPSSGAGLTRYFDDYKSKIQFKPGHIIIFTAVVVLIILVLHVYGSALLGVK